MCCYVALIVSWSLSRLLVKYRSPSYVGRSLGIATPESGQISVDSVTRADSDVFRPSIPSLDTSELFLRIAVDEELREVSSMAACDWLWPRLRLFGATRAPSCVLGLSFPATTSSICIS